MFLLVLYCMWLMVYSTHLIVHARNTPVSIMKYHHSSPNDLPINIAASCKHMWIVTDLIRGADSSLKLLNLTAQNVEAITKNRSGGSNRMYCDSVSVPVSARQSGEG